MGRNPYKVRSPANQKERSGELRSCRYQIRMLDALQKACLTNVVLRVKDGQNSLSGFNVIDLGDVRVWDDFFTPEEIERSWKDDPELNAAMTRCLEHSETRQITIEDGSFLPAEIVSEAALESVWPTARDTINSALRFCAQVKQKTDHPKFVMMWKGESATRVSDDAEEWAERKRPDFAGFLYDPERPDIEKKRVHNRIPGDAKLHGKINHSMLPPYGKRYSPKRKNLAAKMVLTQIHGYMDSYAARYGYIITEKELICFRRREGRFGQLDVSSPIKHAIDASEERNTLNSKYVLFHLHHVVSMDSDPSKGWHLRAYGKMEAERRAKIAGASFSTPPAQKKLDLVKAKNKKNATAMAQKIAADRQGK
jgi:hypothetical protein